VLTGNLSDRIKHPAAPCFFDAGDHEWITKPSAFVVQYMVALPVDAFEMAERAGSIRISKSLLAQEKLQELRARLLDSTGVPEKWKQFLR